MQAESYFNTSWTGNYNIAHPCSKELTVGVKTNGIGYGTMY